MTDYRLAEKNGTIRLDRGIGGSRVAVEMVACPRVKGPEFLKLFIYPVSRNKHRAVPNDVVAKGC